MRPGAFLALLLGAIVILSYTLHRTGIQNAIVGGLMKHLETNQTILFAKDIDGRSRIWPIKSDTLSPTRMEWTEKDKEVKGILRRLDQLMPSVTFTDINTTTSAKNSKATILNRRSSYCIRDPLMVQLDLYDHLGKRKEYGGDFLRARIYSSGLKAGASGRITDYRNGTYLVNFTLFWAGNVRVSLLLIHPSEGVSALWAARKKGYGKITFTGKFLNGTSDVSAECGFVINTNAELCEYLDERDQEAFYCVKPKNVPCEAFVRLKSNNKPISYLTSLEQSLLKRSNVGVEIPQTFGDIHVITSERRKTTATEKCRVGMTSPSPSGFVWQSQWHPVFCNVSTFNTLDRINACLNRKLIYLLGDSTGRQWIEYLTKTVSALKYIDTHGTGKHPNLIAVDMMRKIQIHWKKHSHPIVTDHEYMITDHSYTSREIDNIAGDRDTAVVIALGQHFRPFPIELFIRRAINARRAIQRLLLRSPDTKVIIKAENIREMDNDQERFSDFHGYAQYVAAKDIFRDLNVGLIDAWDMTVAYGTNNVHPPDHVVGNQINMFFTYIC
ncbi:NXPE family member 4-like [Rhineura floridana]|uniref:NXPE family member 4-like n=1 Tax=Rhineura floridana TaxID=261503 RepID=UPI002AC82080|nr:NXPE family member 4-like [Rhineura floridana]